MGEEVSLLNALWLARRMLSEKDCQYGELSFESLQAVRELYYYYEDWGNAEQCRGLRLEYPAFFQLWDLEA